MSKGRGTITKADGEKTMFSSTYQPLKNGRKPRVFSQISKEFKDLGIEKATPEAVKEAYEYLLALPLADVSDIAGKSDIENDMPSLMVLAAKEMIGKRGIEILKEMLDRAHGKATQRQEIAGSIDLSSDKELTKEQAAAFRAIMQGE